MEPKKINSKRDETQKFRINSEKSKTTLLLKREVKLKTFYKETM